MLSDSTDTNAWIAEELAWDLSRRRLGANGRFFYRRRYENTARKAGNLAEFCRRWGGHYQQMLVFDADSVMCGDTVIRLARLMQSNPHAGIIQTIPRLVNRNTLFARTHQFAGSCYGPVLAAGPLAAAGRLRRRPNRTLGKRESNDPLAYGTVFEQIIPAPGLRRCHRGERFFRRRPNGYSGGGRGIGSGARPGWRGDTPRDGHVGH